MQEPLRNAAYWPTPCGLLHLLFYSNRDHQHRVATTHNELGSPLGMTNKKKSQTNKFITGLLNLVEAFSRLQFPFSKQI